MKAQKPLSTPDERVFTLSDVKKLWNRQKKKAYRAFFWGALLGFLFFVTNPPAYVITASFKESATGSSFESKDFSKLLGGFTQSGAESQTIATMLSLQVLKPLAEQIGMQAEVAKKSSLLSKAYRRIKDNLLAQCGKPISEMDWFSFRDVNYPGNEPIHYTLHFEDRDRFSILAGQKVLTSGLVGSKVTLPEGQFTLIKTPTNLRFKFPYPFSLKPWVAAVQEIRSNLKITNTKLYRSVFDLKFKHRDRVFGTNLLNGLMEEYRKFLKKDHDGIAKEQLAYLENRQAEIFSKMSDVFDEYEEHLQNNFRKTGQFEVIHNIDLAAKETNSISQKIHSLDLELEQLECMEKDLKVAILAGSPLASFINDTFATIANLKQKRDLIELSLTSSKIDFNKDNYENRKEELKTVRNQMSAIHRLLCLAEKSSIVQEPLHDQNTSIEALEVDLRELQGTDRNDWAEYLHNRIHLLSMQEKMLQDQILNHNEIPPECLGADLETLRSLFVEYSITLDKSTATLQHLEHIKSELDHCTFEISSLGAFLLDPFSQHVINKASKITFQLKDQIHCSEKERERWTEDLKLQKKILKDHIDQLSKAENLKLSSIKEKINAIKILNKNSITQQISVLQETLSDTIKSRKKSILAEKSVLNEMNQKLRNAFSNLPTQLRKEKWLTLKSDIEMKMIKSLTDLVESKTIGSHLHQIESKPLDHALLPEIPLHPSLVIHTFLVAFVAGFGSFFRAFLRNLLSGFPTSKEKLQAIGYPLAGEISPLYDGPLSSPLSGSELDTLRQISLFLNQPQSGKVIGLIEGKGPDYSHALAEHLSHLRFRSLIVRCDFQPKFTHQDLPGLLQVWKKEVKEIPIKKGDGYDILPSGGYTPYGTEVIRSESFQARLEELKKTYDYLLLVFRSDLHSAESYSPLSLCDKALVTVSGEPTEQLTPFVDWAYHEEMCRLFFLTTGSI